LEGLRTVADEYRLAGGEYSVVTFDPRGTGFTIPYPCPTVDAEPGSDVPINDPVGLNATFVTNTNQGLLCGQEEYKLAGEVVGTAFVARDVDSLFQALGEDGLIRYWGFSYGTLLGSTIAAMFPEKIDRMILDGNINPTDYYRGLNQESVDDVDAALLNYFVTCAEAGPTFCALADGTSSGQELNDQFLQFLGQVKTGDITVSVVQDGTTTEVPYVQISSLLYSALKSPRRFADTAETLVAIYQAASTGTGRLLKREEFDPLAANGVEANQALTAITCGDWVDVDGTLADFEEWLGLYQERSKFGGDQLISILYGCATWQVNAREKFQGLFTGVETKTPILFINGPYDPVTPLSSAKNSSSGFVGSKVLETLGAGHCSSAQPSTCIQRKVTSYWQTGELPDVSQACLPDLAAYSDAAISSSNFTGADSNSTSSRTLEDDSDIPDDYALAVANLAHMFDRREVEFPAALHNAKRDLNEILRARQVSSAAPTLIPATCTPTAGGSRATGSAAASGTGAAGNGAAQLFSNTHIWSVLAVMSICWLGMM
jgi:pimeloyl-ACP methyl ester carboxylesterase